MNKDFRHQRVNMASPLWAWRDEIKRRIANAARRANHRRERQDAKREIMEAVWQ
jgi:hypothetical protein